MTIKTFIRGKKGSSMVIYAAALIVIMGAASLAVDIGFAINEKAAIANAADAAALAGAQELASGNGTAALSVARAYLEKNGMKPVDAEITINDGGNIITVRNRRQVNYAFARILGINSTVVRANASAGAFPVSAVGSGVRPFAIEQQTLNFGQQYILKEGAGGGKSGNYGALALGGSGASKFKDNIIYGYSGSLKVGDYVNTEPGNMKGPTESGVQTLINNCRHFPKCTFSSFIPDCSRIITVVIVDSLDVNGRSSVRIEGFASFFLENVESSGGHTQITGRFIKTICSGDVSVSQTDYGLKGIKLLN
ncbi:MAG: pilus assembly protein TadG-related protein [Clostridia bacterium]|nr:pilus assembly protein TadG-related protein [Clostridia bacterium]